MIVLGYFMAVIMGIILGVIGGGGSILTVPILVYLMGVSPDIATGYSLLLVGATAAFGAYRYFKDGLVDIKASLLFAAPSIVAVYVTRAFVMPNIPDTLISSPFELSKNTAIMLFFAALMLASAVMMLVKAYKRTPPTNDGVNLQPKQVNVALIMFEGAVVGFVTGILGAGGGFLIIPALVLFLGMPIKNAVGASLFIIALKSLIGFIGDLQAGIPLEVPLLPFMLVATLLGMAFSTKLSKKLEGPTLQKFFGLFTLVIAVFIISKELV
ncbi:sulfite exporter TauE/SafE family protein [Psychrosphaera haliotis]|uniref:Probable membrane transporter protein n=1 Tax=Psychrosphaera haliotis TaxID=555083 RepID=A0A6N8F4Q5_9GAMM|nr:sulfite exporter TauE/SafE family protein [Psychrosphaera haliotis]MUH71253.1 TSUP family transporter [Psychrosphaera haliotis]